jgi:cytoskeletal protein RodZ
MTLKTKILTFSGITGLILLFAFWLLDRSPQKEDLETQTSGAIPVKPSSLIPPSAESQQKTKTPSAAAPSSGLDRNLKPRDPNAPRPLPTLVPPMPATPPPMPTLAPEMPASPPEMPLMVPEMPSLANPRPGNRP